MTLYSLVVETVLYSNSSSPYVILFLDASKVFDGVFIVNS